MKLRKVILYALVILALIFVLGGAGFWLWANDVPAIEPEAQAALASDSQVTVEQQPWLVFRPTSDTPTVGFIFYPGGKVPAEAYAVLAKGIAEEGYLVVVPSMPLYLAVLNASAAAEIIQAFPEVETWAIGGHSLGGSMAALYLDEHPDQFAGLVLLASYPADSNDLSSESIQVLSIFGSNDGVADLGTIEAGQVLLPATANFVEIEGGNHAGFGYYGLQAGDGTASIPKAAQHQQTIAEIIKLLSSLTGETP